LEGHCRNGTLPSGMKRNGFRVHYLTKGTSSNREVRIRGERSPTPRAPRAHFAHLTSEVRPLPEAQGWVAEGKLATRVRAFSSSTVVPSTRFVHEPCRKRSEPRSLSDNKNREGWQDVCGQSLEFVAVPGIAERLLATLPQAIREALERVQGFAGCAVMVSEREVRLVTVVTFWRGKDRERQASSNAHWVEKLLDPYVDRQLRMHKLRVQIALQPETRTYIEAALNSRPAECR
jgi:hypothetical protein